MKKVNLLVFILVPQLILAQKYTISGYIEDATSSESLIGASIYSTDNNRFGATTNAYGFYSITLPAGAVNLTWSYVGYTPVNEAFFLTKDTVINIRLDPVLELEEVVISSRRDPVKDNQMGLIEVPLKTIMKLPVLLGETDIMKSIQMLPGIKGGVEGTSGIYVRGGSPDQNLILIDGVPVYNVNHLFGFFSVFNSDAISNFDVIKGGFPARYGGHLSSVIDVRMKEGNMQEYNTSFNIGLLSSSIMTEGPIIKDKCSFMISGRRSYLDAIAVPAEWIYSLISDDFDKLTAGYFLEDLNAKINYKFSDRDRLFLSFYNGRDKLYATIGELYTDSSGYQEKYSMSWGNQVTALRWNHIFTPRLFANSSLTYSKFHYNIGLTERDMWSYFKSENAAEYKTSINDLAANMDFNFILTPSYTMRWGISGIYHRFNPGISASSFSITSNTVFDTTYGNSLIEALEYSAYMENDIQLGERFSMNIGGRLAAFDIRDTLFISPEPRISFRAMITENFSVKASYSRMKQFVNLLTSTSVGFPTDIWVPSTDIVLPQNSTQYSISTNFNLKDKYDLIIEGYYKKMDNLVEYKDGASLFLNFDNIEVKDAEVWENKITQGEGWSYGVEFLLRKDVGKLNGWLAYTLSWSNRRFDDIDNGEIFPFTYDRRHDLALVLTYKLNDKIDFGLNWVYNTGNAITLATTNFASYNEVNDYTKPQITYRSDGQGYPSFKNYVSYTDYYSHRNNFRMPAYHRLDLAVNFTKEKKHGTRVLSLGLYNAYCHLNPFMIEVLSYYENQEYAGEKVFAYGMFPIIPSISYHFKFK
ncbi:MAG: TonB-dependent receptor [Bacteroidales bacterium]|nr:TonB-dependent receptor [Bacteroidales bacterium]